jgi:hypothetical protein
MTQTFSTPAPPSEVTLYLTKGKLEPRNITTAGRLRGIMKKKVSGYDKRVLVN